MKTVLVVDDEFDLLQSICAILEMEGYRVLSAASGRDALQVLESEAPDLVITDYMMPYVSGTELLEQMHRIVRHAKVPAVLMSGVGAPSHRGPRRWSAFLQKPFTLETLTGAVERLIGGPADDKRGGH
jgi:CheY-like chemotaxis protein